MRCIVDFWVTVVFCFCWQCLFVLEWSCNDCDGYLDCAGLVLVFCLKLWVGI